MNMTLDFVPPEYRRFVGLRPDLSGQWQRADQMSLTLSSVCMAPSDSPHMRVARNTLLLCPQTEAYLYDGDFGFLETPYRPGAAPLLESYIASVIKAGMSDGDKVVALSQSIMYDLPRRYPKVPIFLYGESDEQTILKGGGHCACMARLLCSLCQVLGIQARPALMWLWYDREKDPNKILGGHTVAEVLIDGRWGFFDPQHHLYCRTGDGRFHSIRDIRRDPDLFTKMPGTITDPMEPRGYGADQGSMTVFDYYWYKNFNPQCPISISRHDVNAPYNSRWNWATPEFRDKQRKDYARHRKILSDLAAQGGITDSIYGMSLSEFRGQFNITDGGLIPFEERL